MTANKLRDTQITLTLADIAKIITAELRGNGSTIISGLATLTNAKAGQVSFLANKTYKRLLSGTQASAVIVSEDHIADSPTDVLICPDPYLAYAKLSHHFDQTPLPAPGVHPTASVHESVILGDGVCIGPYAVVQQGVSLGKNVVIGPACVVEGFVTIGDDSLLHPNVTVYHHVVIGMRANIHSGAVIGSDGFGFANNKGVWHKIAQLGSVRIGNDVEIGGSTTIDRGALDDTVIGDGVIIDNQVQIAHNVKLGNHTAIAACSGVSGSTAIGQYCTVAGAVGIAGHLDICDGVQIGMGGQVTNSITEPGTYASGTGLMPIDLWRRNAVRFRRLNELYRRFVVVERKT